MTEHVREADELYLTALRGQKVSWPMGAVAVPGLYKMRYPGKDSPWCAVRIVERYEIDDETGEQQSDSIFECTVNGRPVAATEVWPYCGRFPITRDDYKRMWLNTLDIEPAPPADPIFALPALPAIPAIPAQTRPPMEPMPEAVATAVNAVMSNVGYVQKKGENKFHGYKFAAIGDVMEKLQPAMAEAGLIIVQDEQSHTATAEGALMEATYQFTLIHKSGATWLYPAKQTGVASAKTTKGYDDKALNKCHTAARKYFLMALFQIPTGDHDDADAQADQPAPVASIRQDEKAQRAFEYANFLAGEIDKITSPGYLAEFLADPEHKPKIATLQANYPDAYKIVQNARERKAGKLTKAVA